MKATELKERTKKFAVGVLKLVEALPRGAGGKQIAAPLVRCGTAVGSVFRSACKSRNRYDFMARIAAVEEAADESCYWFELVIEAELVPAEKVQPLLDEAKLLQGIFKKSRKAAVRRYKEKHDQGDGLGGIDTFNDEDETPF